MTNEQILKKAIRKAVKNGFEWNDGMLVAKVLDAFDFGSYILREIYIKVVFSHDFAKAFWGTDELNYSTGKPLTDYEYDRGIDEINGMIAWQYHLQQIVLEKDPIQYLKKFL